MVIDEKIKTLKNTVEFWKKYPDIKLKGMDCTQLEESIKGLDEILLKIKKIENELYKEMIKRNEELAKLMKINSRVNKAAVSYFGEDSDVLNELNLIRLSERKRPVREAGKKENLKEKVTK